MFVIVVSALELVEVVLLEAPSVVVVAVAVSAPYAVLIDIVALECVVDVELDTTLLDDIEVAGPDTAADEA